MILILSFLSIATFTRGVAIGKVMGSKANRPVVKKDMLIGNSSVNAIASISNGCALSGIPTSKILRFSCVNVGGRSMGMDNGAIVGIILRRSARVLSRMIIATLKLGHRRGTLKCTIARIGNSSLGTTGAVSPMTTLRKGMTNIRVHRSSKNVFKTAGVRVHNTSALGKGGRPVCIVSKIVLSGSASKGAAVS